MKDLYFVSCRGNERQQICSEHGQTTWYVTPCGMTVKLSEMRGIL